ncbi:MAG: VCBS repeat-containing protein [Rhodocyclaceae bacterium]
MKIAGAALQLESSHAKLQHHELHESLRAWIGNRRPGFDERPEQQNQPPDHVHLSDAAKNAQSLEIDAIQKKTDETDNDPRLSLLKALIFTLTGREVKVFNPAELQSEAQSTVVPPPGNQAANADTAEQSAGYGIEYDRHESYTEIEQTRFEAGGSVKTADGKETSFSISISMARSYSETSDISIRTGDARKVQDPLVLNFNGSAAQLTSQRFKFDLDSDGKAEDINFATGGSGFLAFDRNDDGKINNGSELFGARSGNGFAELAEFDADHNGWIDENDAIYDKLRVWSKSSDGEDQIATLRQATIGALSLAHVATPFDLKDGGNALQGQVRSSGILLQEDGKAGTMQQIDLTV